jgi:hypothetical protein
VPCRRGDIPPRGARASVSPSPRLEDDLAGALPRLDAPVRMRRQLERQHVPDVHLHLSRRDVADEVLQRRRRARPRPLGKPLTKVSAISAMPRQPWSIVREWPRFGIFTISVTAGLRRCRL